jgi:DNA-binding transcriptional ArsR family regulator
MHNYTVVQRLGLTFSALSDPTRRAIVDRLSQNPATIQELTEPFELSQQAISKHVSYLVRAQIVEKRKFGRQSVCAFRPESIKAVSDWALHYRRFWEESFDKLDKVLEEMKSEKKNAKKR